MSAAEVQRKMGNGFHFIVSEFQHKIVPATCGNLRGRKRWRKSLTTDQPLLPRFKKYSSSLHKVKQPLAGGSGYGVGCGKHLVSLGCMNGCGAP